jgi:hypothetical protein
MKVRSCRAKLLVRHGATTQSHSIRRMRGAVKKKAGVHEDAGPVLQPCGCDQNV